ncbi:hypothetical protein [Planomonospora parontospora]|uniref:hypothetical protein n=1 Tax=Planomonospora parontospora TaxID=58119 RepID=UPI0016701FD5|nr:hypothetical protein [Planomonospora parontospora]GGL59195.1 hypothetical protein GCM10014719_70770 [Planomonospora parontospora subsp. antibiotica]GII20298.1 hypothetical protein Ppa05_70240 [Planomonospora parontospora subsp. antibiotica]
MRVWTRRQWAVAVTSGMIAALVIGTPTAIVDTPFFSRMTPVSWWNYPVWIVTAALSGLIVATYVAPGRSKAGQAEGNKTVVGGVLSVLAVGCPVCNKLIVLALGASGAVSYFAPLQPVLAAASVALLGYALRRRLQTMAACPVPPPQSPVTRSDPPPTRHG